MGTASNETRPVFGWSGFFIGAVALVLAVALFWAGPFAPQPSAGTSLGELAGEIAQSAARQAVGLPQPEPEPTVRDVDTWLDIGVGVLGAIAVVLGAAGLVRRETMRPAIGAAALGAAAVGFQFFAWYAMAVLGILLVMAVIHSLGDVFSGIFGG